MPDSAIAVRDGFFYRHPVVTRHHRAYGLRDINNAVRQDFIPRRNGSPLRGHRRHGTAAARRAPSALHQFGPPGAVSPATPRISLQGVYVIRRGPQRVVDPGADRRAPYLRMVVDIDFQLMRPDHHLDKSVLIQRRDTRFGDKTARP